MSKVERFVWLWARRVLFIPPLALLLFVEWLLEPDYAKDSFVAIWTADTSVLKKYEDTSAW